METIDLGLRRIGPGDPCLVVAEAGVNHNGDVETACRMIDVAAQAGADAVKFQTFRADRLALPDAPKAAYQARADAASESQHEMLRRLELSEEDHRRLQARCREKGVVFLSTPFEEESADLLERLGVPAFKVPSGEVTNLPFLEHVARKRKPILLSTGMATEAEVDAAVSAVRDAGNSELVLLHCVSCYPADPADVNLRAMLTLGSRYGAPAGYSDHTLGIEVALAAAALGARVIEKHFTLDPDLPGPDHRASLRPEELAALVRGIRSVESALGNGRKRPAAAEAAVAAVARKSLVASADVEPGRTLTRDLISILRPGTGISPARLSEIVGRRVRRAIRKGSLIREEDLE